MTVAVVAVVATLGVVASGFATSSIVHDADVLSLGANDDDDDEGGSGSSACNTEICFIVYDLSGDPEIRKPIDNTQSSRMMLGWRTFSAGGGAPGGSGRRGTGDAGDDDNDDGAAGGGGGDDDDGTVDAIDGCSIGGGESGGGSG